MPPLAVTPPESCEGPITTIIIVHYGAMEPTLKLVADLKSHDADVVVVANDLALRPAGLDRTTEWIIPPRNLGYGGAIRLAYEGRKSRFFVFLNTDIVLPLPTFERCIQALHNEGVGISAPVLRFPNGRLQSGAAELTRWRKAPKVLIDPGPRTVSCGWVTGAIMFARAEVLGEVGIDGSYFLGAEDADLCLRARRSGWSVVCCGEVSATHHGAQTIVGPRWTYYVIRNRVWFVRANFGRTATCLAWAWSALCTLRILIADILKLRGLTASRLAAMALRDSLRRKPSLRDGPLDDEPRPASIVTW